MYSLVPGALHNHTVLAFIILLAWKRHAARMMLLWVCSIPLVENREKTKYPLPCLVTDSPYSSLFITPFFRPLKAPLMPVENSFDSG